MTHSNKMPTNPDNGDRFEESINGRPATRSEVAYRDGYVNGRVTEHENQNDRARIYARNQEIRDNDNAARGLLLGFLLTALVGIVGGLAFFFTYANRENESVEPASTIVVPDRDPAPSPAANEPQNSGENPTVIERTIENTREYVPVPQQQPSPAPAPRVQVNTPPPAAPDVEVNVPPAPPQSLEAQPSSTQNNPAPAATQAPQTNQSPQELQPQDSNVAPDSTNPSGSSGTGSAAPGSSQ